MFTDTLKLKFKAGNGGRGLVSFRHEKFVINGGPDGGNGGNGGSIILVGDKGINNLFRLTSYKIITAPNGENGGSANKYGRNATNTMIKVPFGTIIKDNKGNYLGEINYQNPELLVAHGGRGGRGNKSFQSNKNQAPDYAEPGGKGEEVEAILELKTIADIGLLGFPNAGKSTLLKQITNANPKVANYPFTTLSPNLGVLSLYDKAVVIADIPGIIKGASKGLGLGFKFLRHIERCRAFIHLVDCSQPDFIKNYYAINDELKLYNNSLISRPTLIYFSKLDCCDNPDEITKKINKEFCNIPHFIGSNYDPNFINNFRGEIIKFYEASPKINLEDEEMVTIRQKDTKLFEVIKNEDYFEIKGEIIYNLFHRTDFNKSDQVLRFAYQLRSLGIEQALLGAGCKEGDVVVIEGYEFIFEV